MSANNYCIKINLMWTAFVIQSGITLGCWFLFIDLYRSDNKKDCIENCQNDFTDDDVKALTITTLSGLYLGLYFLYVFLILIIRRICIRFYRAAEEIYLLIGFNFIYHIFICIYGILYYFTNINKMNYKPRNLLIISCSIILLIYSFLISLTIYMVIQVQRMYRDVYSQEENDPGIVIAFDTATSFEDLPTIIYQSYHKFGDTECCICMQNFVPGDIIKVLPNCFHYFHFLCIQEWFKRYAYLLNYSQSTD